jgi:Cdc6-like AAA superfamily ATPase
MEEVAASVSIFHTGTQVFADVSVTPDIAGVPGTGKTATVHAVVKQLTKRAEEGVSPAC